MTPDPRALELSVVYDVCHNTSKVESHVVGGERREVPVESSEACRTSRPPRARPGHVLWQSRPSPVATLRDRLIKLAVWITRSARRTVLHLPRACPWLGPWRQVAQAVGARAG